MQVRKTMKKIMSVLVALAPFLNNYAMPGLGINMGLCVIVAFVVCSFIQYPKIVKPFCSLGGDLVVRDVILNTLFIYLFICSFAAFLREDCDSSVFSNVLITYTVLLPAVKRLRFNLLDKEMLLKTIEVVAVIGGIVICLQYLFYYGVGYSDKWLWIPFESWTYVYSGNSASTAIMSGLFRPSGIFTEPSHYSIYASIALAYRLFQERRITDKTGIFITIASILSTSGMGIAFAAVIWVYYLFVCDVKIQNKIIILLFSVIVSAFAFAYLYRFEFFRLSLERMFSTSGNLENAYTGRLYTSYILDDLNLTQRWLGMGYRNIPMQLNGLGESVGLYMVAIVELQYCLGYVGTGLFLVLCFYLMIKAKGFNRLVIAMYIVRVFMAGVVNLPSLFFYAAVVSELFFESKYVANNQTSYRVIKSNLVK